MIYGGTLTLTNVNNAAPLTGGETFKIFQGSFFTGTFAIDPPTPGSGMVWNTNNLTIDGTVSVVALVVPQPRITSIVQSGTNPLISGTNGPLSGNYTVLASTNLALPLTNWSALATNAFTSGGAFSFTNGISPVVPVRFYLLRVP